MKILYVHNFEYPDYQSDTVYHGLIDSGFDVYETHYPSFMLNTYENLGSLMGSKGFTLYGKLEHLPKLDFSDAIIQKISDKFYDVIIYGCIYDFPGLPNRKCLDYIDHVKNHYPKDRVYFIDGADSSWNSGHALGLQLIGKIWKTNLIDYGAGNPITFGIPESQLIKVDPKKEKMFSDIFPGKIETYIYDNEKDYYNDYATSYYGTTFKKSQWNCLRHFEILANKCIPYFPNIEDCPPLVMTNFPKELIRETNKYASIHSVHPNYNEINDYLFEYTKNNLTTKKIAQSLFR